MIPPKLKQGDEVRVVAPAVSLGIINQQKRAATAKIIASGEPKIEILEH